MLDWRCPTVRQRALDGGQDGCWKNGRDLQPGVDITQDTGSGGYS